MSIPSLHAPVVGAIVPSLSMIASCFSCLDSCRFHTRTRTSLMASISACTSAASKRRRKSPAVVGSGTRSQPNVFRYASSVRSRSMSSRRVPPVSTL